MEFFRDSKIDFMGIRRFFLILSAVAFLGSVGFLLAQRGLNLGIDFAGGTQLVLKFKDQPDVAQLRNLLEAGGLDQAQLQSFGEEGANEVILKTPTAEGTEEGSQSEVERILGAEFNGGVTGLDLNLRGSDALAALLFEIDPDGLKDGPDPEAARSQYGETAAKVMEIRRADGMISDWSQVEAVDISPAAVSALKERTSLGEFAVLMADNVGPQIGSELRTKGILAVAFSLMGMMAYIWIRFEFRFGIGALAALVHDVVICLGLYALAGHEFDLTTIAAFLTVVGYSVNDSVVIFDRVRENLRRHRRQGLLNVLNLSLNQTLSRTVLTSGTTLLVVGTLYFFGGDVIRGFAFVLLIGVIIGTYSSIYIASPVVLMWERFSGARRARAAA